MAEIEQFHFLQKLSFSPLRRLLQDSIIDMCSKSESLSMIISKLEKNDSIPKRIWKACLEEALQEAQKPEEKNILRSVYGDSFFPPALMKLEDPPWVLSMEGSVEIFKSPILSIVGSREPCRESQLWMSHELGDWPQQGWVFASGGARGIDQQAHELCLRWHKPTLVILPSGLKHIYPSGLQKWRATLLESGSCWLSEFPDDFEMRKYSFSFRNRLIAAVGRGLCVVEAGEKSGSVMTGHLGLQMGQTVCAVPGHPLQRRFRGNLELIRHGAYCIENACDLSSYLDL